MGFDNKNTKFQLWDCVLRRVGWMACILLVALCSCSSSKNPYKKQRKITPCDCPRTSYTPTIGNAYVFNSTGFGIASQFFLNIISPV